MDPFFFKEPPFLGTWDGPQTLTLFRRRSRRDGTSCSNSWEHGTTSVGVLLVHAAQYFLHLLTCDHSCQATKRACWSSSTSPLFRLSFVHQCGLVQTQNRTCPDCKEQSGLQRGSLGQTVSQSRACTGLGVRKKATYISTDSTHPGHKLLFYKNTAWRHFLHRKILIFSPHKLYNVYSDI